MTWYTTPGPPAHRGTFVRGRLVTDCQGVYEARQVQRVTAGQTPDPEDMCPTCAAVTR